MSKKMGTCNEEELNEYSAMNKKYIVKLRKYIEKHHPLSKNDAQRNCNMDTAGGNLAQATLPEHHSLIYFNYQGIKKDGVKKNTDNILYSKSQY